MLHPPTTSNGGVRESGGRHALHAVIDRGMTEDTVPQSRMPRRMSAMHVKVQESGESRDVMDVVQVSHVMFM